MDEPSVRLSRAYELIGRAVIEWAQFERAMISQIWRAVDPQRRSPFPADIDDQGFYSRWKKWCALHRSQFNSDTDFERFRKQVVLLNEFRDDLCHNVFEVVAVENPSEVSLGVVRRELRWRSRFNAWAARISGKDPRKRQQHAPMHTEVLRYDIHNVTTFLSNLAAAQLMAANVAARRTEAQS